MKKHKNVRTQTVYINHKGSRALGKVVFIILYLNKYITNLAKGIKPKPKFVLVR